MSDNSVVVQTSNPLEATLQNVLDQKSLKWIFVGGKGGVGKTTTSCSLAVQLAKCRESVLLISTDPAHNLSDAFSQKFGKEAVKVDGFENLSAMEIDPQGALQDMAENGSSGPGLFGSGGGGLQSMLGDLQGAIPGIDEAMGFAEVMKQLKSMEYSCIVFDTAPTGHTLRFLSFPSLLERALSKIQEISGRFGGMINQVGSMMGMQTNQEELFGKMEETRRTIEEVNRQFKDPELTTFVCVCISEFLSLYETERMVQDLASYEIDTHNVVVNQLLLLNKENGCEQCNARRAVQRKYLDQIEDLYEDFHIVKLPLVTHEVRGPDNIRKFSEMLVKPYQAPE
ncbi:Golgi to ER traffic-related protein [Savitreella phatthalungensis]